jgi:hypothetical protein
MSLIHAVCPHAVVTPVTGVCAECGTLTRTGTHWGLAPGQPRLDPEAEHFYRLEQQGAYDG